MKKFEYKIVNVPLKLQKSWFYGNFINEEELQPVLREQSEEGWELIQIVPYAHTKFYVVYATIKAGARLIFKREIHQ